MSCGVTKFLCCLPLSLGAYIIGAISILASAILIILDSVYFAGGLFAIEDIFQDYENDCNDYYSDCGDFDLGMIEAVVSAWFGIWLALNLLFILINSMLIYGTAKERPGFLMPWIVFQVIVILFGLARLVGSLVLVAFLSAVILAWTFVEIILALICGYMLVCIMALRTEIQKKKREEGNGQRSSITTIG